MSKFFAMRHLVKGSVLILATLLLFTASATAKPAKDDYNWLTLPIRSEDLTKYYFQSQEYFQFFLKPEYAKQTVRFTEQEASVELTGGGITTSTQVSTKWEYYEVGRFYQDGYLYKLVMYNFPWEFDDPYFNIQLNVYDSKGQMVHSLLLDTRYEFEDVEGLSKFVIEADRVQVQHYAGYRWNAEDINCVTIERPVLQLWKTLDYEIHKGAFILIAEETADIGFINQTRDE